MSSFLGMTAGKHYWSQQLQDANYQLQSNAIELQRVTAEAQNRASQNQDFLNQVTQDLGAVYQEDVESLNSQHSSGMISSEELQREISNCQKAYNNAVMEAKAAVEKDDYMKKLNSYQKELQRQNGMLETQAAVAASNYQVAKDAESNAIGKSAPSL